MDGSRFDAFTRTLATSRCDARKTLLRGAAAGIAALLAPEAAGTAVVAGQEAAARKHPLRRAGQRCNRGQPCGELAPCTDGCCTLIACSIDGLIR